MSAGTVAGRRTDRRTGLSRRRFIAVCATAALSGSSRATTVTRERFKALGGDAQITLIGHPAQARAALKACRTEVENIEAMFSLYDPRSMLSRLNRDGQVQTSDAFVLLMRRALAMAAATGGAFDPTIQPLWQVLANGDDIDQARQHVDWRRVVVSQDKAYFTEAGMAISLNGIAQGHAADRVSELLSHHGFTNTLVDLGEFVARGTKDGEPWRLGIRNPVSGRIERPIDLRVRSNTSAIATSEPRGTLVSGQAHIMDPLARDGERWASVTVEARSAWRADALSTSIAASPTI